MVVHVGNSYTVDDVLDLQMVFETKEVGPIGKFKGVEVEADNELEEESDTEEKLYNDHKHDLSIGDVEVQEHDIDVIDYDSFGSDLDGGIDCEENLT
ncbi:hypothetical protein Tco_1095869 [Tanacetum coccineum]